MIAESFNELKAALHEVEILMDSPQGHDAAIAAEATHLASELKALVDLVKKERKGAGGALQVRVTLKSGGAQDLELDPWDPGPDLEWRLAHSIQAQPNGLFRRIVAQVRESPSRYRDLRHLVAGSDNLLTVALKRLAEAGILASRPLLQEARGTYQYELTPIGKGVALNLDAMRGLRDGPAGVASISGDGDSSQFVKQLSLTPHLFVCLAKAWRDAHINDEIDKNAHPTFSSRVIESRESFSY